MSDQSRLRQQLRELEARRPSIESDPDGYRRVTEEMARLTDRSRMYQSADGWKVA